MAWPVAVGEGETGAYFGLNRRGGALLWVRPFRTRSPTPLTK
jgi:hypothetical protein